MNRLEKDLLFFSNYCLHSSNLINSISKTSLNEKIFYICIDDKKIKVPNFITRVPSIFLVQEKKVLVEDEIDMWIDNKLRHERQKNKSMENINVNPHMMNNMSETGNIQMNSPNHKVHYQIITHLYQYRKEIYHLKIRMKFNPIDKPNQNPQRI